MVDMNELQGNQQYQDQSFQELEMDGADIDSSTFIDCTFRRSSFAEARLTSSRFQRCIFEGCDLSLVDLSGSTFASVEFHESKLVGVDWTRANTGQPALGKPLVFRNSILNHGTFIGLHLEGVRFLDCSAREVDFREADLSAASFSGTDLRDSLFLETNLTSADFRGAKDYQIDAGKNSLSEARFSLPEALSLLHALDIRLDDDDYQV